MCERVRVRMCEGGMCVCECVCRTCVRGSSGRCMCRVAHLEALRQRCRTSFRQNRQTPACCPCGTLPSLRPHRSHQGHGAAAAPAGQRATPPRRSRRRRLPSWGEVAVVQAYFHAVCCVLCLFVVCCVRVEGGVRGYVCVCVNWCQCGPVQCVSISECVCVDMCVMRVFTITNDKTKGHTHTGRRTHLRV